MNKLHDRIHFIGCEGVSMKMLKAITQKDGYIVSGSDLSLLGHNEKNVDGAKLVVYSAAIKQDNPELLRAKKLGIDICERAKYLGQIMDTYDFSIAISGSHGKTTTTAMLWEALRPFNPTVHIGGTYQDKFGALGGKNLFITEACEYNRSFLSLTPDISLILNVDLDHTDCYDSFSDLKDAFIQFANATKKMVIFNGDEISFLPCLKKEDDKNLDSANKNYISFGFKNNNDYYASCINPDKKGRYSFCVHEYGQRLGRITLSVAGIHNVFNALAVIALARSLGLSFGRIAVGLSRFYGASRRMEFLGFKDVSAVFSDYAHHPSEINMSLLSAKQAGYKHITAVFEPHTYTRTKSFFADFVKALSAADRVVLLPIYAAREEPLLGVDASLMQNELKQKGCDSHYFDSYKNADKFLKDNLTDDGVILFMGAGSIDAFARDFVKSF